MARTAEGRSTACVTCLRRKKGCDRQRPSCGQCRKACIACGGYCRPYSFRSYETPKHPEGGSRPDAPSTGSPVSNMALRENLADSAYESTILGYFWKAYLPKGRPLGASLDRNSIGGFIEAMRTLQLEDGVLRKSALALCFSTVGWQVDKPWIQERGRRYYAEALRDMAAALGRPRKAGGTGLLAAARLFSFHEVNSWLTHNAGEMALILANPPSFYASGLANRLFVDGRAQLIFTALYQRKRTFLGDMAWKTLPWSINGKTWRDRVLDILVDIPTLFEAVDAARGGLGPGDAELRRQQLVKTCLRFRTRLARWCSGFSPTAPPWDAETTGPVLDDDDIAAVHVLTLYWISCLLVDSALRDLLEPGEARPADMDMDPDAPLRNIIKAISYFYHPSTGLFRAHLVTFPLIVALLQLRSPQFRQGAMAEERKMLALCLERRDCLTTAPLLASLGGYEELLG